VVVKEFLKKKLEMIAVMSLTIIADVFPIIAVMVGLWIVKHAAIFFGLEGLAPIQILITFSEVFMVILYIITVILSMIAIYKLFKEGEL
jgi:hypothetical protein